MITKKAIVDQILLGGKLNLDEAVKRAMAIKQIKNKDAVRAWKNMFAQNGVISREETGVYVSPKPVVEAPKVAETPAAVPTPAVVVPVAAVEKTPETTVVVATPAPKTE